MSVSARIFVITVFCGLFFAPVVSASDATYRMTVVNTWTQDLFPTFYPSNAHWASLGGGAHSPDQSFWEFGGQASSQMESMAEGGNTSPLRSQIVNAGGMHQAPIGILVPKV